MSEFTSVSVTRDQDGQILANVYGRGASTTLSFAAAATVSKALPFTASLDPSAVILLTTTEACYFALGGEDVEATTDSEILTLQCPKTIRRSPGQTYFAALGVSGSGVISATEIK